MTVAFVISRHRSCYRMETMLSQSLSIRHSNPRAALVRSCRCYYANRTQPLSQQKSDKPKFWSAKKGILDGTKSWTNVVDELIQRVFGTPSKEINAHDWIDTSNHYRLTNREETHTTNTTTQHILRIIQEKVVKHATTKESYLSNKPMEPATSNLAWDLIQTLLRIVAEGSGGGGGGGGGTRQEKQRTMEEIIHQARAIVEQRGELVDSESWMEVLDLAQQTAIQLDSTIQDFFGTPEEASKMINLNPTNLFYYLEYQDQVKNPSWKRRQHFFSKGVEIKQIKELRSQLDMVQLSSVKRTEDLQQELLEKFNSQLVYCNMESFPGKPSHFISLPKDQASLSSHALEVTLVVRGTKSVTDIITDLLCDAQDYKGGKAHAGILKSGQYLAKKHVHLLQNLLKVSGKRTVHLTLIGHSLGAGAASIAGMELQEIMGDRLKVQVIGFGCPALVSKNLSEQAKEYVTTVIADDDCIPRMSTATMLNAILDISQYDWRPSARKDVMQAIYHIMPLKKYFPSLFSYSSKRILLRSLEDWLETSACIPDSTAKRMEPVLFPPGKCIHIYRDGYGISGAVVPCSFFEELNISRRMVEDHLYGRGYQQIFSDLMRQHQYRVEK